MFVVQSGVDQVLRLGSLTHGQINDACLEADHGVARDGRRVNCAALWVSSRCTQAPQQDAKERREPAAATPETMIWSRCRAVPACAARRLRCENVGARRLTYTWQASRAVETLREQLRTHSVLKSLRVRNYRTFPNFSISFRQGAYLMGPNNAGKSSLLTSLRLAQTLLRHAWSRRTSQVREHRGATYQCYPANLRDYPALAESVRHEFGSAETTVELTWDDESRLTVVWPDWDREDDEPFFYLKRGDGFVVTTPAQARAHFPRLGIIPPLGPVDHSEALLEDQYVRSNIESRVASRHFRNHLRQLVEREEWTGFLEWSQPWRNGIDLEIPRLRYEEGASLDVLYHEPHSRVPKELIWAGDGIQVWLQILFHLYRVRDCDTVVLDEPEVFLHPDLQRRLVALLDQTHKQVVMATHSAEIAAEVDPGLVALVDRSSGVARRAESNAQLETLRQAIGSGFNLRLAKALHVSNVALVECRDIRILRLLAQKVGLATLAAESSSSIIPLGSFTSWEHLPALARLTKDLLAGAASITVVVNRDFHSEKQVAGLVQSLGAAGIGCHVWERNELESYLISSEVIARVSGASLPEVERLLERSAERQRYRAEAQYVANCSQDLPAGADLAGGIEQAHIRFGSDWLTSQHRWHLVKAGEVISTLNGLLSASGWQTVSASSLAQSHRAGEIAPEMVQLLKSLDNTD